jgi:hypothetical protein
VRTYHVEVEVGAHLGQLGVRLVELHDIVVRTELAELLSSPEGEANSVLDLEVGQGKGGVENTNGAGAIIAVMVSVSENQLIQM